MSEADAGARDEWVRRVLGVDVPGLAAGPGDAPPAYEADPDAIEQPPGRRRTPVFEVKPGAAPPTGMAAWKAARAAAIGTLKQLEAAYRGFDHPDSDMGVMLLRAIQANLTVAPSTPQQVDELESYIAGDDIFEEAEEPNGFGIAVVLRKPLLQAVESLRSSMGGAVA